MRFSPRHFLVGLVVGATLGIMRGPFRSVLILAGALLAFSLMFCGA